MLRRVLLVCGALASVLYLGIDFLAAVAYPDYHSYTDRAVSELMASGAPTERLVDPLFLLYGALMLAFGVGVWMSDRRKRVRITGGLLCAYGAIGLPGPLLFEMNVRGSGGDPTADVLHIAITTVLVAFIFASVAVGASTRGRSFRVYSYATLLLMAVLGVVTAVASPQLGTVGPTPWLGLSERLLIGTFLLWVAVLALALVDSAEAAGVERRLVVRAAR